jgi:hypothetical protein
MEKLVRQNERKIYIDSKGNKVLAFSAGMSYN